MTLALLFFAGCAGLALYASRPVRDDAPGAPHLQIKRDLRLRARIVFALRQHVPTFED